MNTKIIAEELLEYVRIPFPENKQEGGLFSNWIDAAAEDIVREIGNVPVELFGETTLSVALPIFLRLRDRAREITYRSSVDSDARVIFSSYPNDVVVRPQGVSFPVSWSNGELDAFSEAQASDQTTVIVLPLDEWWEVSQASGNPLAEFLRKLYSVSPAKDVVALRGLSAPVLPSLLALNWFIGFAKQISLNEAVLYRHAV